MSINGKADILIEGGKIFCGKGLPEDKEFIAVADGKIVAVGKGQDEAARFKGSETKVIALGENELVIPGLHDNHIHLMQEMCIRDRLSAGDSRWHRRKRCWLP